MDSKYEIEKNISMPKARSSKYNFPFDEMEIGNSFFVDKSEFSRARASASIYGKANNKKFETRVGAKGGRVWRTK